ncbi:MULTISPECIES: glycosyltransferase family 2 protein [Desulfosporosinus]|uniref:Glycosyltransferase n=1 Tax=Desulfosporosinus nitroreducens TaxID=2018668 RepID=A0ABT8QX76_9FIRM|nr:MULTISPECIES: glycosyltransferase family 2 protein [Desulfosporosinus]MCO1604427.1 glycosyltransferase [Desulfosporosinus nitroreducens]MDA8223697.1 glycosyltransferase family 2 protein [Desulfitobacterium hafniense]MDO0825950.1 glycosyltransferase [Desulfosporosinus nitroreducens]
MDFLSGITGTQIFNVIMLPIQIIIIFLTFYYFILSMFGLYRKPEVKIHTPEKSFAIVVAAHNEEAVIGPLIENLLQLDYPKKLYDIFVVADNCTDKTSLIAKNAGAIVHRRFNAEKRGKGYALEWMFYRLFKMERQYDAIIIFDADNLVKENFLFEMNSKLCQGHKIVQCYLDSKNPFDTWVTNTFSIAFWVTNRMLQLARFNTGRLSNVLGGTGMCISTDVLKEFGWGATSLTEDLEFSMKALSYGIKTTWAHDAVVYDEKPLTFIQAWHQRKRWAQGQVDVAGRYFFPLIIKGIREKKIMYFDAAIHLFQPALVMIATFFMLTNLIDAFQPQYTHVFTLVMPWTGWQILSAFQYLYPVAALALDRLPWRAYVGLILYPIFIYSWIPIVFLGFINRKDKQWSHTKHTRSLSIEEVIVKQKKISSN